MPPLALVIVMNVNRRHLDESQRAMVAAGVKPDPVGGFSPNRQRWPFSPLGEKRHMSRLSLRAKMATLILGTGTYLGNVG